MQAIFEGERFIEEQLLDEIDSHAVLYYPPDPWEVDELLTSLIENTPDRLWQIACYKTQHDLFWVKIPIHQFTHEKFGQMKVVAWDRLPHNWKEKR
jgi:hypothetical protein